MLKQILTYIFVVATSMASGILVADIHAYQLWQDDIQYTINACEADGLADCHTEYNWDGLFLNGYEVVGRED